MEVIRRRSELESSPGVMPKYDSSWWAFEKRPTWSMAATNRSEVIAPTPGTVIRRRQTSFSSASPVSSFVAALICSVSCSMLTRRRSTKSGSFSPRLAACSRMRSGNVLRVALRTAVSCVRDQARALLTIIVRDCTSTSRIPHIDLTRRDHAEGKCTEGKSSRQDASLNARASRRSVFFPRAPTPSRRTSRDGTTRTSWPSDSARSAIPNASVQVSTITRRGSDPSNQVWISSLRTFASVRI